MTNRSEPANFARTMSKMNLSSSEENLRLLEELGKCNNAYIMKLEDYFSDGCGEATEFLDTGELTIRDINRAIEQKRKRLESLGYKVSLGFRFELKEDEIGIEKFNNKGYYLKINKISKIKRWWRDLP